jgi:hypothetical protein
MLYLFRFSKHTSNAVESLDKHEIQKAFKYLKKYYVYIGILTIVALAGFLVSTFIAIGSAVFMKGLGTGI